MHVSVCTVTRLMEEGTEHCMLCAELVCCFALE